MSSTIFYRFRSQKDSSRILFDGTGLTVFDLKREIIQENKLGDGTGFQLRLYNPDTKEEYDEDQIVITRSSSVIVQRSPAVIKTLSSMGTKSSNKMIGNATRYTTGKPRVLQTKKINTNNMGNMSSSTGDSVSEEDRIANMFANQENQWAQTQQEMSTATPIIFKNNTNVDDGPPPPGYMCYRCGSRDHWIKNCPTNSDPNFEGKRIRRTTGIPKKFLKSVEVDPNSMTPEEMAQRKIMITDEGKFVVQVADEHSWEDYQRKQQNRLIDSNEAIWLKGHFSNLPDELKCPITGGLIRDPVKTSKCCEKVFSKMAIEDALLESDFVCPECHTEDILLDSLIKDDKMDKKIQEFIKTNAKKNDISQDNHIDKKAKIVPGTIPSVPPFVPPPFPMFPMGPPFIPMNNTTNNKQPGT